MAIPFSLAIITLNEENNLERCIKSVPFADEVVVLDSGSTDKTIDLARRLGARVALEPWRGFAKQKTRAAALCKHTWVLSLDADEALSPEAQSELKALLETELTEDAYSFPRLTQHLGKWLRHGGAYPDRQVRFFNKTSAKWSDTEVHEKIEAGKIKKLKSDIFHWPFPTIDSQVLTINRYSALRAKEMFNKGKRFSLLKLAIKPISKFFEVYILKRGFLDGLAGLEVAYISAFSYFLRWIKLYEYQKLQDSKPQNKTQ